MKSWYTLWYLAVRYGIDGSVSSLIYHDLPIKSGDFHMLRVPPSLPAAAAVTIFQETRQDRTRRGGLGGGAVGSETSVSGDAGGAGYLGIYPWLGFGGTIPKFPKQPDISGWWIIVGGIWPGSWKIGIWPGKNEGLMGIEWV